MNIKPIVGFEGYGADEQGNIYSFKRKLPIQKKTFPNDRGYLRVTLSKNNRHVTQSVHRLLALTFIPNPDNKPQVNHIDSNRMNNKVDNLEWVTCSENVLHGWHNGRVASEKLKQSTSKRARGSNNCNSKLSEQQVMEIIELSKGNHPKYKVIAEQYGVNYVTIWKIVTGRGWKHLSRN